MGNLARFLTAQEGAQAAALAEIAAGRKTSHWMWFILPQMRGLGSSPMAQRYGIADLAEARAYLAHPVLGPRLRACIEAALAHENLPAEAIFGAIDAMKFRSCLTLFEAASGDPLYTRALDRFYAGRRDERTLALIRA